MPAWIIITVDDLNEARVAELVASLRAEALGAGQPDPMPGIISKVTGEIRSCIGYCANTPLDIDPAKVPANLKDLVVQKILRTMKGRLLMALSEDEVREEKVYQDRLKLLTQCAWPVDRTDTPIAIPSVTSPATTPMISARPRTNDRCSQDGS